MCVCGHLGDEVSASRLEGQGISRTVNNIELILQGGGQENPGGDRVRLCEVLFTRKVFFQSL